MWSGGYHEVEICIFIIILPLMAGKGETTEKMTQTDDLYYSLLEYNLLD